MKKTVNSVVSSPRLSASASSARRILTLAAVAAALTIGTVVAGAMQPPAPARIRVSGPVEATRCTHCNPPSYPALARQAHVQGIVKIDTVIGTNGKVKSVQLITGHPLLAGAAMQAVRGWQYQPTVVSGAPVEVETIVSVDFNLAN